MQPENPNFSNSNYFHPYYDNVYYRNDTDEPNDLNSDQSLSDAEQRVDSDTESESVPENSMTRQYYSKGFYHHNYPYYLPYGYYPYPYQYGYPYAYPYYPYYYQYPGYGYGYNLLPWLLLGGALH